MRRVCQQTPPRHGARCITFLQAGQYNQSVQPFQRYVQPMRVKKTADGWVSPPQLGQPAATAGAFYPVADVFAVELKGDYLTEAGQWREALRHYAICTHVYKQALGVAHDRTVSVTVKLARACGGAAMWKSAETHARSALTAAQLGDEVRLELVCEGLMELGNALRGQAKIDDAATVFLECASLVSEHHDMGSSHRAFLRWRNLLRRFGIAQHSKMRHFSLFDFDRIVAIADAALHAAEGCYRAVSNSDGQRAALRVRAEMLDRKWFNIRDYAGRIRTNRGKNRDKAKYYSSNPTADELLRYFPTIHQPSFDWAYEATAPLGSEDLVRVGANAKLLDDGDPLRHFVARNAEKERRTNVARDELRKRYPKINF